MTTILSYLGIITLGMGRGHNRNTWALEYNVGLVVALNENSDASGTRKLAILE